MDRTARSVIVDSLQQSPVVVTGAGSIIYHEAVDTLEPVTFELFEHYSLPVEPAIDCREWLRTPKTRKFMGKQDQLAVIAAGRALRRAGLVDGPGDRVGLYLVTGYIPFERTDIETLALHSVEDNRFSMQRFGAEAIQEVNPLLTFRCLPNMPAFHVSLNFQLTGEYYVAYPDTGQWYLALEQAVLDLQSGRVDAALVGSVADQNNFLVRNLNQRLGPENANTDLDTSSFVLLETEAVARSRNARPVARLTDLETGYESFDPFADPELIRKQVDEKLYFGAEQYSAMSRYTGSALASLALEMFCYQMPVPDSSDSLVHELAGLQQFTASSQWHREPSGVPEGSGSE